MAGTVNPVVEILVNSTWTDISADVQYNDNIDTSRGRPNEGTQSDPAEMTFTVDNRTGNYSPRNPRGIYYGQLARNTKVRASVKLGQVRARQDGVTFLSCPSSVGLQITGDMDLRADVWLSTWRPENGAYIGVVKVSSYGLFITTQGYLSIGWYTGGVFNSISSTVSVPGDTVGQKAVRASLRVNDGAGNRVGTFYYSSDNTMSGTWIQFDQVTTPGTTTVDSNANVLQSFTGYEVSPAELNEVRVYSGLAVTLRADPVFTSQANGTSSFSDAQGNTWSTAGGAAVDNKHYRFWGDGVAWPIKWDVSGAWRYATVTASGLTRRLGQSSATAQSALRRAIPASLGTALVGYWPLEEDKSATQPESVVGGTIRPKYIGNVEPGASLEFVAAAQAPTLNKGRIWLPVKTYANTNYFQVRFLLRIASTTIPNNTVLARIWTNSTLGWIDWVYQTGDIVFFKTYTNQAVNSLTTTPLDITNQINGQECLISFEFKKNGTGVDLKQVIVPVGEDTGYLQTDTNASITLGACTIVYFNPDGVDIGDVSVAHARVEKVETSVFDLFEQTQAYRGEEASARIARLCRENNVTPTIAGLGEWSEAMGTQGRTDIMALLEEAATVDGGILHETRMSEGLRYRSRESLQNQDAALTISYAAEGLAGFEPTDDDQRTRNRVTVTRVGGNVSMVEDSSSSTYPLNNSPSTMSTSDPPGGVGLYDEGVQLSLYSDDMAQHQAGWRVNVGTVDEARFPVITLNLAHPDYTTNPALTRQILLTNVGDRLVITNPPTWLPPEQVDQIVQGVKETINQFEHTISFNCAPAKPYRVARQNDTSTFAARYSNLSTVLAGTMTTGATSVSVSHSSGPDWTIADGSFDIMVNGERMTVTNIVGSGTQTFTVTRSVNGISKTHSIGEGVRLFDPVVYGVTGTTGNKGSYLRALEVNIPDPVMEYGNGINSITALFYSVLPTTPLVGLPPESAPDPPAHRHGGHGRLGPHLGGRLGLPGLGLHLPGQRGLRPARTGRQRTDLLGRDLLLRIVSRDPVPHHVHRHS
jgi:hypothetical protein